MSYIEILNNTKGNIACSRSIDPGIGCLNTCVGCYAKYVSYKKDFHTNIEYREWDENIFIKSCRKTKKQGHQFIRIGKLCDPLSGEQNITNTKNALKCLTEEKLTGIVVSKSLQYNKELSEILNQGNHTLHISLGMITKCKNTEKDRLDIFEKYIEDNINVKLRIVDDITRKIINPIFIYVKQYYSPYTIITPLRVRSREEAFVYSLNMEYYKFHKGYFRPQVMHNDWNGFGGICGEVGDSMVCCQCLTGVN